LIRH